MIQKIRRFLKKETRPKNPDHLSHFARDISQLKQWALYINQKNEYSHQSHRANISLTRKEVEKLSEIIGFLQKDGEHIKGYVREITKYLYDAHSKIQELEKRVKDIEGRKKGQQRTTEGQEEGQQGTRRHPGEGMRIAAHQEVRAYGGGGYTNSQKDLLRVLYQATGPLDYTSLARILRKKEKSIRNMIYELREKGVEIRDTHVGARKKGFFLEREEKIKISGR